MSKIRHLISLLMIALWTFNITNNESINQIHDFVEKKLVSNWSDLILARLTEVGIIRTLFSSLAIGTSPEVVICEHYNL